MLLLLMESRKLREFDDFLIFSVILVTEIINYELVVEFRAKLIDSLDEHGCVFVFLLFSQVIEANRTYL